ncbi:hypothetical protein [Metaclostridioides mangenotii]|uniref:hypothetical protein n=1 Tax=Metaclostridioides mangenotii TaxID=1540 RepID=UPI000480A7D8|nr:hypothetical protein [Clostridioides mangenotii]
MGAKDDLNSTGIKDDLISFDYENNGILQHALKNFHMPKIQTYENQECKELDSLRESERKINQVKAEFYNNTKIIADSTVTSAKYAEQIFKNNVQLVHYNEMLLKKLQGIDSSLNNLTNEFISHSKDIQSLETDQSDKLEQMIQLLKNPNDKSLIDGFKDMSAQVIIGLTIEALKMSIGIGV